MSKLFLFVIAIMFYTTTTSVVEATTQVPWWEIQSIDTVKYSRDRAREMLHQPSLTALIDEQVSLIAQTGATHVALGTPYDPEFVPILTLWVKSARKHNLKVWFRGNLSGWEEWFDYPRIGTTEHTENIVKFIHSNPTLFETGDLFSSCPECENGGPGDPRHTGNVEEYRQFLITEYQAVKAAFRQIDKNVSPNMHSMNGDVARLVMNPATTQALGGVITVDHYVSTPEQLAKDVEEYARISQGKVILGEFGVPIPDIHGRMTPDQQAQWMEESLKLLADIDDLIGLNYWTSVGGSTELWSSSGAAKVGVATLTSYYKPKILTIEVTNGQGKPISNAQIVYEDKTAIQREPGVYDLAYIVKNGTMEISAPNYMTELRAVNSNSDSTISIQLVSTQGQLRRMIFALLEYLLFGWWQ